MFIILMVECVNLIKQRKKHKKGWGMERRIKYGTLLTLVTSLCLVLLTGCPARHTKEEEDQITYLGSEKLTEALRGDYGLQEGEWQINSQDIIWESAAGYNAVKYSIEAGDRTFEAVVQIDADEVFADYYGKEFGEMFAARLEEKLERVPEYQQGKVRTLSMDFWQQSVDAVTQGMIPTSISPEDFGTYLERCEQEELLYVRMTMAWYAEDAKEIPDDLQMTLTQGTDKLPNYLVVKRFARAVEAESNPMDLKEEYTYYNDQLQDVMTYEYFEVDENLIIRRRHSGKTVWESDGESRFNAFVDKNGHLSIYPEDEFYDLYFKGVAEGTNVFFLLKDSRNIDKLYSRELVKDPYSENWCYATLKGEYKIRVGSFIQNE